MRVVLFILLILSYSSSKENCFINFNKKVCGEFSFLDRVIVKSKLSKNQLSKKLEKPLKQIAFFENSNLYLIDSANSLEYSKQLLSYDFISFAQPDISQKKIINIQKNQNITKKYNLKNIWEKTKGEGVNIAIIDDGFNLKHEDLKDVNLLFSYDVDNKRLTSYPVSKLDTHGTQVAGVIFAGHNDIGINGIAPKANFIAIRQSSNITSDTILAFTVAIKAGADIINCSWNSPMLLEPIYDILKEYSKKTAIVFAAGNDNKEIKPFSTEASIPEVITVGATQRYSNYGKMVDFIITSGVVTTKKAGDYGLFGGTSATAPIITGLLALELSKNKNRTLLEILEDLESDILKTKKSSNSFKKSNY